MDTDKKFFKGRCDFREGGVVGRATPCAPLRDCSNRTARRGLTRPANQDCWSRRSAAKADGLGEQGVALVITLIMLSIITFMAITFLVLSQRERNSTTTFTDQKIANEADATGMSRGLAEAVANMLVLTNNQNMPFLVSTSFVNNNGFIDGLFPSNPTNVNYSHEVNQLAFTGGPTEWARNISDLWINPRVPVFVVTNVATGSNEFRYYYDLNRNGRDDPNGSWPVIVTDPASGVEEYLTTNALGSLVAVPTNPPPVWVLSNNFVGDPEWIGILERPQELHSADNRFVGRYAYMVIPIGNTLDINYVHNRAKRISPTGEGFLRNQGAGTYEDNLAGLLADLNTNAWWNPTPANPLGNYVYNTNFGISTGSAFTNANDILTYRYGGPTGPGYFSLYPQTVTFAGNGANLLNAGIDTYSQGPLMLGVSNNSVPEVRTFPWSGADNTNHVFTIQDFFNSAEVGPSFPVTLENLGTSNDTYNEYTYYRLLAQLGSDSAPEQGKININWKNTDNSGRVVPGMETNLIAWTPIDFFTNAADRMFRQLNLQDMNGNLITVTNIPFYESTAINPKWGGTNINYYTPAVHRVLQLAANMYDATTSRFIGAGPTNYPSVFRPVFRSLNGVASIIGYEEVSNSSPVFLPFLDVTNFIKQDQPFNDNINMYGIPWVVGVKKGFPNFNEMSMNNPVTCTRKIEFTNSLPKFPWQTNQLFDFGITNVFGIEAWNSYTNAYGRSLRLIVTNELTIGIYTNQFGLGIPLLAAIDLPFGNDVTFPGGWPGWTRNTKDSSFQVPLYASNNFTNAIYVSQAPYIVPLNPRRWDLLTNPPMWLTLSMRLHYVLLDVSVKPNRVIDFVNLVSSQPAVNIASTLANNRSTGQIPNSSLDGEWDTNYHNLTLVGPLNQIFASEGYFRPSDWQDLPPGSVAKATTYFRQELNGGITNYFQAPYSPTRTVYQGISWEANDPLVHYTVPDMTSTNGYQANYNRVDISQASSPLSNLTNLNFAYQPWGGYHLPGGGALNPNPQFDFNYQMKDPAVQQSDNWDYPTNKFWNIGILGRIHRGTPWQTIYMKPFNQTLTTWMKWGNDNAIYTNFNSTVVFDPLTADPASDYALFDLFTAGLNDNATRGQLNVNQTNLAAWAAILAGVNVLTNDPVNGLTPITISPAGVYDPSNSPSPLAQIWQGINNTRGNLNPTNGAIFLNQVFQHAGDILNTPQLTVASPFINTNGLNPGAKSLNAGGVSDEVLERIPQQIMSLLTLNQTPRFVIYSFGQTLHPADHSLVIGGTFNGLCTNYQVTAETATRAVVRIDGSPDPKYTQQNPDPQGRYYPPRVVVEQFNVLPPDY